LKETAHIIGVTVENSKVNGERTRWREMEFLNGQMDENTQANIKMTLKMVLELSNGRMGENMLEAGKKASNMGKELTILDQEK